MHYGWPEVSVPNGTFRRTTGLTSSTTMAGCGWSTMKSAGGSPGLATGWLAGFPLCVRLELLCEKPNAANAGRTADEFMHFGPKARL
jgi:hypothetical protein